MPTIQVRVSDDLYAVLTKIAEDEDRTVSWVVRRAIEERHGPVVEVPFPEGMVAVITSPLAVERPLARREATPRWKKPVK